MIETAGAGCDCVYYRFIYKDAILDGRQKTKLTTTIVAGNPTATKVATTHLPTTANL